MAWEEFKQLLSGIGPETPLGRIVAIRSENDGEILKRFTKEQRRIRNEWRNRRAKNVTLQDRDQFLEEMKNMFLKMAARG